MNTQFSISKMMQVTALAAFWLGVFLIHPNAALSLIGVFLIMAWAILQDNLRSLQWLPVAASTNVLASILWESRTAELITTIDLLQMLASSIVFMRLYTTKHLRPTGERQNGFAFPVQTFVILNAAGFLAGLWLAVPFLLVGGLRELIPQTTLPVWLIEAGFKFLAFGICSGASISVVVSLTALLRGKRLDPLAD